MSPARSGGVRRVACDGVTILNLSVSEVIQCDVLCVLGGLCVRSSSRGADRQREDLVK
jgi:hypothetical protein